MEAINVQCKKTLLELENTCMQHWRKVKIDMQIRTHEVQVQIQEFTREL